MYQRRKLALTGGGGCKVRFGVQFGVQLNRVEVRVRRRGNSFGLPLILFCLVQGPPHGLELLDSRSESESNLPSRSCADNGLSNRRRYRDRDAIGARNCIYVHSLPLLLLQRIEASLPVSDPIHHHVVILWRYAQAIRHGQLL